MCWKVCCTNPPNPHLERKHALLWCIRLRLDRLHTLDLLQVDGSSQAFSLLLGRLRNCQGAFGCTYEDRKWTVGWRQNGLLWNKPFCRDRSHSRPLCPGWGRTTSPCSWAARSTSSAGTAWWRALPGCSLTCLGRDWSARMEGHMKTKTWSRCSCSVVPSQWEHQHGTFWPSSASSLPFFSGGHNWLNNCCYELCIRYETLFVDKPYSPSFT